MITAVYRMVRNDKLQAGTEVIRKSSLQQSDQKDHAPHPHPLDLTLALLLPCALLCWLISAARLPARSILRLPPRAKAMASPTTLLPHPLGPTTATREPGPGSGPNVTRSRKHLNPARMLGVSVAEESAEIVVSQCNFSATVVRQS